MAQRAADRLAALIEALAPVPGRMEFATRLALICALTALVTQIYQTPSPALTTYVAFFLIKPDRTSSVLVCAVMLLLLTVTLGFTLVVAQAVVDVPEWRVASMAAISLGMLFLVSASKLHPIGSILALIVAYALDLLGSIHAGEEASRGVLYAWLFVGIPAGVTAGVSLLFAPSPRELVQRTLAERLRLAAAVLRAPDKRTLRQLARALREGNDEIASRLKLVASERTASVDDVARLRHAAEGGAQLPGCRQLQHLTNISAGADGRSYDLIFT